MDLTQIVLLLMIVVLGTTLTLVGVQLFFILREAEKSLRKTNLLLDDFKVLSINLSQGSENLKSLVANFSSRNGSFLMSLATVFGLIKTFLAKNKKSQKDE